MSGSLRRNHHSGGPETRSTTQATLVEHGSEELSIMTRYMQDVRRFPLLTRESEAALARQIYDGNLKWRDLLLSHLIHVPIILARQDRLRSGDLSISRIWSAEDTLPAREIVEGLAYLKEVCDRIGQLGQRESLHQVIATEASNLGALHADIRARIQTWSYQPDFLHEVWTEFDQAMTAASACHPVDRFTVSLGYRLTDLYPLWQQLQDLAAEVETAKQEMVTRNLRLVIRVARDFYYTNVPLIDLIQEGNIGLMRAVEKFDCRRGLKLSTYAVWWIKQAMRRAVLNRASLIRVPEYLRDSVVQVKRAHDHLTTTLGQAPTVQELAEHLGVPVTRIEWSLNLPSQPISLDQPRWANRVDNLYTVLVDTEAISDQVWLEQQDIRDRLQEALELLTPREIEIIRRRFGLDDHPTETLRQIGLDLQLSHERVRQLEAKALKKLAQKGKMLREYIST